MGRGECSLPVGFPCGSVNFGSTCASLPTTLWGYWVMPTHPDSAIVLMMSPKRGLDTLSSFSTFQLTSLPVEFIQTLS